MKIAEMQNKDVVIKCATKEEMQKVAEYLNKYVAWAYKGLYYTIDGFQNGFIFIHIDKSGAYTNKQGKDIFMHTNKIMAIDFLKENMPKEEEVVS